MGDPRRSRAAVPFVADRLLLARVFLVASSVPLLMRLPLPCLAWLLERVTLAPAPDPAAVPRVRAALEGAIHAGWPAVRPGCLTRGVTLYVFLRRAGMDVALSFGMGRPGKELAGHCWLVLDGEPFLERRDPRPVFTEMYRIPRCPPPA